MKQRKFISLLLVLVLLAALLVGCGASAGSAMDNKADAPAADMAPEEMEFGSTSLNSDTMNMTLPENRKLIQNFRITAETEDLDVLMNQLNARIGEFSGYVEGQNIYNGSAYSGKRYRNAELTVRIPADKAEGFVNQISEISNVVSSNKTVDDITLKYVSTESRMKALQTEEARLLELLGKAETMDDLLTIERYLTNVRTELEQVTSSLRVYDNKVDYATVYLSITEVKEYTVVDTPETVGERISAGWKETVEEIKESFEDFVVSIVVNLPYILAWAVVIAVVILLLLRRKRKKAQKNTAKSQEPKTE